MSSNEAKITITLIKTAEFTAASIDLAQLPALEFFVFAKSGDEVVVFRPTFSGVITFTEPTCALADSSKTVNLGKHKAASFVSSSVSAWVDASIELINCNYGGPQPYRHAITGYSNGDTPTFTSLNTANAKWILTLTPATTIYDSSRGVMAIDNKSGAATGIGIQLAKNTNTAPITINFAVPYSGSMVAGVNQSITIPLFARYYRISNPVTPGKADGKVIYTIEYK